MSGGGARFLHQSQQGRESAGRQGGALAAGTATGGQGVGDTPQGLVEVTGVAQCRADRVDEAVQDVLGRTQDAPIAGGAAQIQEITGDPVAGRLPGGRAPAYRRST